MADAQVRPARSADAARIAQIHIETWRIAYGEFLPAAVLETLTAELAEQQWRAAIDEPPSAAHHVLVALEGERTVGFVAFGPSGDDDAGEHTGTIAAMLVEPRWGRRGHGSRMLAAAVEMMRGDGRQLATAWIYDRDRATRALLTAAGWEPDGLARILDAGGQELREIRLHTDLRESA